MPSGGPPNVQLKTLSASSVLVTWQHLQLAQQNGIITGYTIRLMALQGGAIDSVLMYNVSATASSHQIEGLDVNFLASTCNL